MADLHTIYAGLEFSAPIWVSSQGPKGGWRYTTEQLADKYLSYVEAGAAAIELPFTCLEPEPPPGTLAQMRVVAAKSNEFGKQGFFILGSDGNVEYLNETLALLKALRGKKVDVPIIANIIASTDVEEWIKLSKVFYEEDVSMIELNVSCPVTVTEKEAVEEVLGGKLPSHAGVLLGTIPKMVEEVTRAVVKEVDIPVAVKMTPEVGYPQLIIVAESIKRAGAKAITGINAPISIAPPDIYNGGRPPFAYVDRYHLTGTYGPWDRFIAYKFVSSIATNVSGIDISAIGGLIDPEHVIEMMMLGAKTAQFSSGLIWKGRTILSRTIEFLTRYMDEYGYSTPEEFTGQTLKYIGEWEEITFAPAVAETDLSKCDGCKICVENICGAGYLENGVVKVNKEECGGCGICVTICPRDARRLIPHINPSRIKELLTNTKGKVHEGVRAQVENILCLGRLYNPEIAEFENTVRKEKGLSPMPLTVGEAEKIASKTKAREKLGSDEG